jgi:hypothetical protein
MKESPPETPPGVDEITLDAELGLGHPWDDISD